MEAPLQSMSVKDQRLCLPITMSLYDSLLLQLTPADTNRQLEGNEGANSVTVHSDKDLSYPVQSTCTWYSRSSWEKLEEEEME